MFRELGLIPLLVAPLSAQAADSTQGPAAVTPIPRTKPQPRYPPESRRLCEEGTVEVAFPVHQDGAVGRVRVLASPYERLSASVVKTVETWTFEPFQLPDPEDVVWCRIKIVFKMES
ncbi:MAG: TonB family protein [Acidobacteria bacterium]|nr:TonB family protein [Acidobacteriota bacterium]